MPLRGVGDGEQVLEHRREQEPSPRLELARLSRQEILRRDQRRRPRCFQDVLNLARSQRLVDDDRDAAGGSHPEKRGDGVRAAVEEDPDPVVDLESG